MLSQYILPGAWEIYWAMGQSIGLFACRDLNYAVVEIHRNGHYTNCDTFQNPLLTTVFIFKIKSNIYIQSIKLFCTFAIYYNFIAINRALNRKASFRLTRGMP